MLCVEKTPGCLRASESLGAVVFFLLLVCLSDRHDLKVTSGQTVLLWWATTREWSDKQLCTTVKPPAYTEWMKIGIEPRFLVTGNITGLYDGWAELHVHWDSDVFKDKNKNKNTIPFHKHQVIHQRQYFSFSSVTQIPHRIKKKRSVEGFFLLFFVLVSVTMNANPIYCIKVLLKKDEKERVNRKYSSRRRTFSFTGKWLQHDTQLKEGVVLGVGGGVTILPIKHKRHTQKKYSRQPWSAPSTGSLDSALTG